MTDFADLLQSQRIEVGLSFQRLSERSQVDIAYLHRLETGRATRPGRNIVIRIAISLGLDIDDTDDMLVSAGHLPLAYRHISSKSTKR
ncbi:MAG: helix-turn-helix domain-containing protein [Anaerolineales bacterium]|nr:helix-turn-helix domain-containing protein [Anaerolineales bacterium]